MTVLAFALYSCGESMDCPAGRGLSAAERKSYDAVAAMAALEDPVYPLLLERERDLGCASIGGHLLTPKGECVDAYSVPACDVMVLPAGIDPREREWLLRHESLHFVLQERDGDADRKHESPLWGRI